MKLSNALSIIVKDLKFNRNFFSFIFFLSILFLPFFSVQALVNPQNDSASVSAIVLSNSPAVLLLGGGVVLPTQGGVLIFRGYAYPGAVVTLNKNGELVSALLANTDASFEISLTKMPVGNYDFAIQAKEVLSGDLSIIFKFNVNVVHASNIVIDGIFFPPTIHLDKSEVVQGETIKFFGRTAPNAKVTLSFSSEDTNEIIADTLGNWIFNYDTVGINKGNYQVKAKANLNKIFSIFSENVDFKVGEKNLKAVEEKKLPVEIAIPLYPKNPILEEVEVPSMIVEKPEVAYSLWYLFLLLIPILLLLFDRKRERSYGIIPVAIKSDTIMFLLIKTQHGDWGFPKGHRDQGETQTDAALRELMEETGIRKCLVENKIFFTETYRFKLDGRRGVKMNKYFLGFVDDMKVFIDGKEILDYKWGTFGETFDLISHDGTRKVLMEAHKGLLIRK